MQNGTHEGYCSLWGIVNGTEIPPQEDDADKYAKFKARRDRALALIVLTLEPSLLYLIGEPEDPVVVWKKLSDQFQKRLGRINWNFGANSMHSVSRKEGLYKGISKQ